MTLPLTSNIALASLRKADENHAAVAQRSSRLFVEDTIRDMEGFGREAELLLRGLHSADVALGVFDHNRYNPVVEVGDADFRGPMPVVSQPEWMRPLVSLLEKDYGPFPADSVHWFSRVLGDMTFEERPEIEIFHCGIAFTRTDGRPVRLFSKGVPIHYTGDRRFTVTFTFVQNAHLLLKPSFREYWIRIVYGHDGTGAARDTTDPPTLTDGVRRRSTSPGVRMNPDESSRLLSLLAELKAGQQLQIEHQREALALQRQQVSMLEAHVARATRLQDKAEQLQDRSASIVGTARKAVMIILPLVVVLIVFVSWLLFRART